MVFLGLDSESGGRRTLWGLLSCCFACVAVFFGVGWWLVGCLVFGLLGLQLVG